MKNAFLILACGLTALTAMAAEPRVEEVSLAGRIEKENLTVKMTLRVEELSRGATIKALSGDVALLDTDLPSGWELRRECDAFLLGHAAGRFRVTRSGRASISFAVRTVAQGDWRRGSFAVPTLPVRTIAIDGDRPDLEVSIQGARDVRREAVEPSGCRTTAFLGLSENVAIGWKQAVRRLDAEPMASCDVTTVVNVAPGALRMKSSVSYRVAQGALKELLFAVPDDVHVLQVAGEDIQEWRVDRGQTNAPRLRVILARPQSERYDVTIRYERALPSFPCELPLPVLIPQEVIRAGGTLLIGTDSAVKIQVLNASGLTQIDQAAFPRVAALVLPSRGLYTYQYAAMPYSLTVGFDDIVTAFNAEIGLLFRLTEGEASLNAAIQLEVRDAAAREVRLQTDADAQWTVTAVTGAQVAESDVDVRPATNGVRDVVVPFRQPVEGTVMINMRLEHPFSADRSSIEVPRVWVPGARAQRGYIVAAADKGLRLTPRHATGELRDVHTASTPVRVEGAQIAYRFRDAPWHLELAVERAQSAVHSEIFHLVSLGEGVTYVSAAVTYHISGAPVQSLRLHVPERIATIDVVGAGIDAWSRSNDVCTVQLATRIMGDFTLLITYDQPLAYGDADLPVGEIGTLDTDSELGFIAVASSANLKLAAQDDPPAMLIPIQRDEIPAGYAATVTAPVIGAYKYVRRPTNAVLRVMPLDTQRLIGQVVDYLSLSTRLGRDGESVTHALYCVKNASLQYLAVSLPPGASLWSVRRLNADQTSSNLAAQQIGEKLLIPVDRPRDPNQATSIEIVYAQTDAGRPHRTTLEAPTLPDTAVTFASWEIRADDRLALGAALGGNMTPDRPRIRPLPMAHATGGERGRVRRFYRTANLVGDDPLRVKVTLVPTWMAGGSPLILLVCGLAGAVLLAVACWRRRAIWFALALTMLAMSAAQTVLGVAAVTVAGVAVIPLALGVALLRGAIRFVRRQIARIMAARASAAEEPPRISEEPPLVSEAPPLVSEAAVPGDRSGRAHTGGMGLILLLGAIVSLAMRAAGAETDPLPRLKLDRLELVMRAPALTPHVEPSAMVTWRMVLSDGQTGRFGVLSPDTVIVDAKLPSGAVRLEPAASGGLLNIGRPGRHVVEMNTREQVIERDGFWNLALDVPDAMIHRFELTVPAGDLEIVAPGAATLTLSATDVSTRASGAFASGAPTATFAWRPRARDARREQAVVYCDVDTLASIRSGVVDMAVRANYRVVQGEVRELRLRLPDGVGVTAVNAPNLATWSLDPATRVLLAILARPASADFTLSIGMQMPCEGLPYVATLGAPTVLDVQRQHGRLALAAPEAILVRLEESAGALAIHTADFSDAIRQHVQKIEEPLRRAFRYDDPASVRVALRAEAVQPEVRVVESASFSIGDERSVLSTALEMTVAKSGVFAVKLLLPDGYDIESLGGRDVSHWDDSRRLGEGVEVFFNRRVLGQTTLNLVLARQLRGIPERVDVPRVGLRDASRHTGRMAVSAERGVKLSVDEQQGISVRKTEGDKTTPAGVTFDILRPLWQVSLRTQVLAPALKPELLHQVELAEGMLQHRVHVRYKIEHAGVKQFQVRVPVREATLSVSGRHIARVSPVDSDGADDAGRVWQVELHGKVEDAHALTFLYQEPYDPSTGRVVIRAFEALGAARQTAWLAVTGGGRVQVQPEGDPEGLKPEDARRLPDSFGAGDLSGAILCYRALRPDYRLSLSIVRHDVARVLPASVESADLLTVVSRSGKLLTQATLNLRVGDLRFLKIALPSPSGEIWSATVNGGEVAVARDGETFNVPLEQLASGASTSVIIVFADHLHGGLRGRVALRAPRFPDLPLREIGWRLYMPPEFRYRLLESDFDAVETGWRIESFSRGEYERRNIAYSRRNLDLATKNLKSVDALLTRGQRVEAQKALQVAVNASQAERSLNEDARVQFRNVVQQQVKMGLVNRREALRTDNNIFDESAPQAQVGFNEGNFDQRFVARVEERLSQQDRRGLELVAGRIVDQQAAAAGQAAAINITMPEQGREMRFHRAMQSRLGGCLQVVFRVRRLPDGGRLFAFWPVLPGFPILWGAIRLAIGKRRVSRVA